MVYLNAVGTVVGPMQTTRVQEHHLNKRGCLLACQQAQGGVGGGRTESQDTHGMLSSTAEKKALNHRMTSMAAIWGAVVVEGKWQMKLPSATRMPHTVVQNIPAL